MALVNPNIAMSVKPLEIPQRNALAEAAQVMSLQQAQMQMEKLRQTDEAMERIRQVAVKNGGPGDLNEIAQAFLQSPDLGHQQLGLQIRQQQQEKADFNTLMKEYYPGLVGGAPAATAPPTPVTSVQPGALGSGTFGVAPEPAANALVPAPATHSTSVNELTPPAATPVPAPVNALAATEKTPDALRREIMLFGRSKDPGAKNMVDMLKTQLAEAMKTTTVSPGQEVFRGGKVVYSREPTPSEFDRMLKSLNLPPDQERTLRLQWAQKQATHAPATTVNVSTEKKYGEAFGSKLADVDVNKLTTAEKAPQLADSANRIMSIVQQGNVFTGPAADIKLNIARAMNVAGANNQEKIANTESLIAATGQSTLDAIKGAGLGTGQGFTDKDLNFLRGIAGGTINLTPQTLTELARLQHRVAEKSAASWNKRVLEIPKEVVQGTGLSTAPITVAPLAVPAAKQPSVVQVPAPSGIDAALWNVMTPQERALWQK